MPHIHSEDTDNETGQVLHGMDSLPSILRRYVQEDNRWFQQELSEWEEQYCQTATPQEESAVSVDPASSSLEKVQLMPVEPQLGAPAEKLDQEAASKPQPNAEAPKDPGTDPGEQPEGV